MNAITSHFATQRHSYPLKSTQNFWLIKDNSKWKNKKLCNPHTFNSSQGPGCSCGSKHQVLYHLLMARGARWPAQPRLLCPGWAGDGMSWCADYTWLPQDLMGCWLNLFMGAALHMTTGPDRYLGWGMNSALHKCKNVHSSGGHSHVSLW